MITQLLNYIAYPKALLLLFASIGGACWLSYFIIYLSTKKPKTSGSIKNLYYSYSTCVFFIILWIASNAYFHTDLLVIFGESSAIYMAKMANIFSYMSLTFAFIYSCYLTSAIQENKFKLWEIITIAIMTIYAFYVNFISGYTITGVIIKGPSDFTITFGQATPFFFLSLFIYTFLTLFKLTKSIKTNHVKIKQLKSIYTVLGMIIYLVSTATLHLIITFIYDDFSLTWIPPFLAIICLSVVGYASINYRFYSWKYLIYSAIKTATTLLFYIVPITILSVKLNMPLSFILIILWCFIHTYHWKKIAKLSTKIASLLVYKEPSTPIEQIYTTSKNVHNSLQDLIDTVSQSLKLDGKLSIISLDNELTSIYKEYSHGQNSALILDEIEYQLDNKEHDYLKKIHFKMIENNSAAILPIFDNNNSIAQLLLLPRKLNGLLYSNEEIYAIQCILKEISFFLHCENKIKQSQKAAISIAYEMKTPLKNVQSYISKIESQINNTEKTTSLLSNIIDIRKAIKNGHQIINTSLNDVDCISESNNDEYIDISTLVKESVNDHAYDNQKSIDRIFIDIKDNFTIHANKTKITFVIFNLLKNAIYYFDSHPKSIIEIKTKSEKSCNKLYFRDYGPGIEEKIIDSIFSDFFTYKKHNGTGLGLSYCKRVMKSIKGDIHCESIYGEYTEFVLVFPNVGHSRSITNHMKRIE